MDIQELGAYCLEQTREGQVRQLASGTLDEKQIRTDITRGRKADFMTYGSWCGYYLLGYYWYG